MTTSGRKEAVGGDPSSSQTADPGCRSGPVRHLLDQGRWLAGREPAKLAYLLFLAIACWVLFAISDTVLDGKSMRFDPWLLRALRSPGDPSILIGPRWLGIVVRDATALGGFFCLILFTMISAGYLWLDRKRSLALFLVLSAGSGYLASSLLKRFFDRPRPTIVPHLDEVSSSSFPSGHSMNSAVIYLTLGIILAASTQNRIIKRYVIGVALLLTAIVGMSRVFLGVHYPSDVIAGWIVGLIWALGCSVCARALQRLRVVESPDS